jgi:hypothetical protein
MWTVKIVVPVNQQVYKLDINCLKMDLCAEQIVRNYINLLCLGLPVLLIEVPSLRYCLHVIIQPIVSYHGQDCSLRCVTNGQRRTPLTYSIDMNIGCF